MGWLDGFTLFGRLIPAGAFGVAPLTTGAPLPVATGAPQAQIAELKMSDRINPGVFIFLFMA
jgi:hypothetical protein